ncbi:MAG: hypothetical protein AB1716_13400 [Planctomycetota bacterium]
MRRFTGALALAAVAAWAGSVRAEQYWIRWEGDDLPENQGWTRVWGNWQGQYQGPGAYRTLENGVLTYDSLYDPGVYDYNEIRRIAATDPQSGEKFSMEWRLRVEQVTAWAGDPTVVVSSDDAWVFALWFAYDTAYSSFEGWAEVPFTPGVFHTFIFVSPDMRTYELFVDGELRRTGTLRRSVGPSQVAWGEGVQGVASVHHWDYFHFGVFRPGDTNCDGAVDFRDINAFVLLLSDPATYAQQFGQCVALSGDCNEDGRVDFDDIDAFVALLSAGGT